MMQYLENIKSAKGAASGLFVLLLLVAAIVNGQPRIGIDNVKACDHSEVILPVMVEDFLDIGSFTLYIEVDTAVLSLISTSDENVQLAAGTVESNLDKVNQRLILAWFGMTPANIENGKLLDIHLELKAGNASLNLLEESELTLSDLSIVQDVTFNSGSAIAFDAFQTSPPVSTVSEGTTVNFSVPSVEGVNYQWQVKALDDWNTLVDNDVFNGVTTNSLQISSVPLEFNDRQFRCLISNDICTGATLPSTLEVTVGISEEQVESSSLSVYPNPAGDQISVYFTNDKAMQNGMIRITDMQGSVFIEKEVRNLLTGTTQTIDISSLAAGIYLLEWFESKNATEVVKLLKQ